MCTRTSFQTGHHFAPQPSCSTNHYCKITPQADYHELFWALGDAGPQEDTNDHGQRTDILFGSVVRIYVPSDGTGYLVPDDNYPGAGE